MNLTRQMFVAAPKSGAQCLTASLVTISMFGSLSWEWFVLL